MALHIVPSCLVEEKWVTYLAVQFSETHTSHTPPLIVAIDGPAGSGKSTTARLVAERLGYVYLDTGAMYRAMALSILNAGAPEGQHNESALDSQIDVRFVGGEMRVMLDGVDVSEEIRTPEVGSMASRISKLADVREKLVELQRRTAREFLTEGVGVVLDGRDIGTVVFPDADVKVFMVADPEVRARRRQAELAARGRHARVEDVLLEILDRDRQDSERAIAPLRKADDAVVLDTTSCNINDQVLFIIDRVRERALQSNVKHSSPRSRQAHLDDGE